MLVTSQCDTKPMPMFLVLFSHDKLAQITASLPVCANKVNVSIASSGWEVAWAAWLTCETTVTDADNRLSDDAPAASSVSCDAISSLHGENMALYHPAADAEKRLRLAEFLFSFCFIILLIRWWSLVEFASGIELSWTFLHKQGQPQSFLLFVVYWCVYLYSELCLSTNTFSSGLNMNLQLSYFNCSVGCSLPHHATVSAIGGIFSGYILLPTVCTLYDHVRWDQAFWLAAGRRAVFLGFCTLTHTTTGNTSRDACCLLSFNFSRAL